MQLLIVKKLIKKLMKNASTVLILCIFSLIIVQPDKFAVAYKPSNDHVYAAYADLLEQAGQQNDGALHFETLLVGADQDPQLVYIIRPGDTLSDIAKTFGTTATAIMEANGITNPNQLSAGKRLTITYKEGVIHELKQPTSLEEFSKTYNLNLGDLLTLNYIDDPKATLQAGQQIFLDLNRLEAEQKGLIEKREFQALNLLEEQDIQAEIVQDQGPSTPKIAEDSPDEGVLMEQAPREAGDQLVITAEQTEQHLQNLNYQKEQALIAREEAQKAAEREAQKRQEQTEAAKIAQEEAAAKARAEAQRIQQQELQKQQAAGIQCDANQCLQDGKCRTRPENAYCAPQDPQNAWICKEGFRDTGKECVPQEAEKPVTATAPARETPPTAKVGTIVKQWYFNPYKEGYNNGRAGGYCTHYAGRYRWKEYGISTNWRGNARARYKNASAAGWAVGQTPEIGSIIVMKNGAGGRGSYGHVGIVKSIDRDNREVMIEDMNYVGRYIASQHWVDMDSQSNPIIGYVYPRAP